MLPAANNVALSVTLHLTFSSVAIRPPTPSDDATEHRQRCECRSCRRRDQIQPHGKRQGRRALAGLRERRASAAWPNQRKSSDADDDVEKSRATGDPRDRVASHACRGDGLGVTPNSRSHSVSAPSPTMPGP